MEDVEATVREARPADASRSLYRRIGFEPAADDMCQLRLDAGS